MKTFLATYFETNNRTVCIWFKTKWIKFDIEIPDNKWIFFILLLYNHRFESFRGPTIV